MEAYHDQEWGVPVTGDNEIFERMILEMFQAGLSWRTILHKRDGFRDAFCGFDPACVAIMTEADVERLLARQDIVRYRRKIEATIENAKVCQDLIQQFGSLREYLATLVDLPLAGIQTEFKKQFQFMGPVVTESFLQCMGMNGPLHEPKCWKYKQEVGS